MLAAVYLPPFRSKYGLRARQALDEYFCLLGDEVAAAATVRGGADVLVAGDLNAHTGMEQDGADHSALLQAALPEEVAELLAPCTQLGARFDPPPRASSC